MKQASITIPNIPFTIEGDRTTLDYVLSGETNLITDEVIEKLKAFPVSICFNDTTAQHWIFDFDINNIMFEGVEVLPENENKIVFNVSKLPELFRNKQK